MPRRPARSRPPVRRLAAAVAAMAGLACPLLWTPELNAQPEPRAATDALDVTGRSFAGLRLPTAPVPGAVEMAAHRARTWVEEEFGRRTQRVLLEGEVAITLGPTTFEAERAALWIEALPGEPGDAAVYQVYAYFDSVGSAGAEAGSSLRARRLSVDGVVMAVSPARLAADLTLRGRPRDAFLLEAERECARYLRELLLGEPVALDDVAPEATPPEAGVGTPGRYPPPAPDRSAGPGPALLDDPGEELFAREGVITFDAGQITLITDSGEADGADPTGPARALLLTEGVGVLYRDTRSPRRLRMSAQRAVVFLDEEAGAAEGSFRASDVRGIYLEGDVSASDGEYTIRGPRIYYDVAGDRALIVDAVFWTYDQRRRMPLYVRADALRQESAVQFSAEQATLANTRFARPHLSIGADSVTVKRQPRSDGTTANRVDARGLTLRAGPAPVLYWPRWVGDPERFPLRGLGYASGSRTGQVWRTSWDAYALLGIEPPEGLSVGVLADYYNSRGFAFGTDTTWDTERMQGGLFGYLMLDDHGRDFMPTGGKIDVEGETRSLLLAENRWRLGEAWSLTTELAYASDPRLITALFPDIARNARELTTRARLDRTTEHSQLSLEARGSLNDFVANEYLLQSRGYSVDRLPELTYTRTLDDLAAEWAPGALTLTSEYRLGSLAFNFHEPDAAELGYRGRVLSQAAFGVDPAESIADRLREEGLGESAVTRFDTRHEVGAVLDAGPVRVNPFVVGRLTAYDTDFPGFSPESSESTRLWGAAGARLSTTIQRVDNTVSSELFDLHRTRHIIEPGVTVWHAGTTVDAEDLPVYDEAVEAIAEGSVVRVGLDQTWQTQRGGPGRWRSVDVLRLRTEYVWASGDAPRESPIGRFVEDRPELSRLGEFIDAEALWQVSDPVGLTGRLVYDIEGTGQLAYSALGLLIDHGWALRSSLGQRSVNALDSTVVFYNLQYQATEKYRVTLGTNYDTTVGDFERFNASLVRSYPNLSVGLAFSYNNISDDVSVGIVLSPRGLSQGLGVRTGGSPNDRSTSFGG